MTEPVSEEAGPDLKAASGKYSTQLKALELQDVLNFFSHGFSGSYN